MSSRYSGTLQPVDNDDNIVINVDLISHQQDVYRVWFLTATYGPVNCIVICGRKLKSLCRRSAAGRSYFYYSVVPFHRYLFFDFRGYGFECTSTTATAAVIVLWLYLLLCTAAVKVVLSAYVLSPNLVDLRRNTHKPSIW